MAKKSGRKEGGDPGSRPSAKSQARARSAELRRAQVAAEKRRRLLWQLGLVVTVAVVVVLVTVAVLVSQGGKKTIEGAPPGVNKDGGIYAGATDAAVTVTMIEDFQCPACRQFEAANKSLLDTWADSDDVRLEYRPIAFLDRASTTDYSSRSLNAAACFVAEDPDDWRAYHELLYANQPAEGSAGLTDGELTDLAVKAGTSKSEISTCIDDNRYETWVKSTTEVATGLADFDGTPTVFVNDKKVENPSPETLEAAVEAAQK